MESDKELLDAYWAAQAQFGPFDVGPNEYLELTREHCMPKSSVYGQYGPLKAVVECEVDTENPKRWKTKLECGHFSSARRVKYKPVIGRCPQCCVDEKLQELRRQAGERR